MLPRGPLSLPVRDRNMSGGVAWIGHRESENRMVSATLVALFGGGAPSPVVAPTVVIIPKTVPQWANIVGLFHQTNALADGCQVEPDVLPSLD